MAFFRLPRFYLHSPYLSDWYMGSTSGNSLSIGTPWLRLALDSNVIRIPLQQWQDGKLVQEIILKGGGLGVGVSAGLDLGPINFSDSPKNLPGTKTSTPGVGTRLLCTPTSPNPMTAHDFNGVVYVIAVNHTDVGVQASGAYVAFCSEASWFSAVSPPNAVGLCVGFGLDTAILRLGGDAVAYTVKRE